MTTPSIQPVGPAGPPGAQEISALITWMKHLSDIGPHQADPAELAAFLAAKRDLLTRIERHSHPTTSQETFVD